MAKILVIDDEESMLHMVERTLVRVGHEIHQATNGREALEFLRTHPIDLIITDLYMPDIDGLELTVRVGQLTVKPPIIVMSGGGYAQKEEILQVAQRMGAARTLAKPFSPADLVKAVKELIPEKKP